MTTIDDFLTDIARHHLGIATLDARYADSLDFHDVSVCGVKNALSHAYQAGVNASSENAGVIQKQLTSCAMFHTPGLFRALQNDYRIKGNPRLHAIKTLSTGYGLSREEAAGLLCGAIKSEIDDAAGTVTFTSRAEASPAMLDALRLAQSALNTAPRFRVGDTDSYKIAAIVDEAIEGATARRGP
jgi:hypothetical protein